MILCRFGGVSWPLLPKMGSDRFEILASNAIPFSQSYMLQYEGMVEIQSKQRFFRPIFRGFWFAPSYAL